MVGAWFPALTKGAATVLNGWNGEKAHQTPLFSWPVQGSVQNWTGTTPGETAPSNQVSISASGGSGGFPGGSVKQYPGGFGKAGKDGTIIGAP